MIFQKVKFISNKKPCYKGRDAWNNEEPVYCNHGETITVSQEKAAQLLSDFPKEWQAVGNPWDVSENDQVDEKKPGPKGKTKVVK